MSLTTHYLLAFLCGLTLTISSGPNSQCGIETSEYDSLEEYRAAYGEVLTAGTRVNMTDSMHNDGAVCLDGSVPVFYFRKGFGDGLLKFHVFLEGGGECAGFTQAVNPQYDTCAHRSQTSLGSSHSYRATMNYDSSYTSTSEDTNPLTYNWNTIYVKYCDGSDYGSNNETVVTVQYQGKHVSIYFRGFRILNGVFDELMKAEYGYAHATDLLFSGCSAGGIGVFLHMDYVYHNKLPSATTNMGAMPDSGFFLEYQGKGQMMTPEKWQWDYMNYSASLNQDCLASKTAEYKWYCLFAQETTPFSVVPTFALQSEYDSWQIQGELVSNNAAQINVYGQNLTDTIIATFMQGTYAAKHSMFLDSCSHHCGKWNQIKIDGYLANQAQYDWYNKVGNHGPFFFQNKTYPCTACCHPN